MNLRVDVLADALDAFRLSSSIWFCFVSCSSFSEFFVAVVVVVVIVVVGVVLLLLVVVVR